MVRLLRANIARLWKTKSFWVCMMLTFGISVMNCITTVAMSEREAWAEATSNLFTTGVSNAQLFTCIFIAMFIGTDYSNGTIRNKLIIGSSRFEIYVSNLITVAFGGILIGGAQMLPNVVAACFGDKFGMSVGAFTLRMIIIVCAMLAISAIFTLVSMMITSKSANAAVSITGAFLLLLGAMIILNLLQQPEYTSGYELTEDGSVVQTEQMPNPMYVSGVKREALTIVNDVLPSGQSAQLETGVIHNENFLPLYSLGVIAITTAVGVVLFRKKDLK